MGKSSLATIFVPAYSGNYTQGRRGNKISKITVHHMAGVMSATQCGALWQRKGRRGSSHYGIGNDGAIGNYVDENNIAWTDSNWNSNCTSVTIETSNNATGGDWTVSDKALNSLIKLVADIAKRNNLGTLVPGKNLTWHSMYAKTTCPGNYLRSKMQYIADEANKINCGSKPTPQPTTKDRVARLQEALNQAGARLVVDNSYGPLTKSAVNKYWNSKPVIKWVQQTLNERGYGKLAIDGSRGPLTRSATKSFQKARKLVQDGNAGPISILYLATK